jgi:hypothetical protein
MDSTKLYELINSISISGDVTINKKLASYLCNNNKALYEFNKQV